MRLITWNCNGGFRNKFKAIAALEPDVLIVQECEDPERCKVVDYKGWATRYLWRGVTAHKGIGVFCRADFTITPVELDLEPLELFLPCIINGSHRVLATWTREANSPTFKYIGQLWKFLEKHPLFLEEHPSAVIGDLNSNAIWDVWDRWWNHSDVVKRLQDIGLESAYHEFCGELQGKEQIPTFFMHRKRSRPYHIDYAFLSRTWLSGAKVTVGEPDDWLKLSDHMPLIIDTK